MVFLVLVITIVIVIIMIRRKRKRSLSEYMKDVREELTGLIKKKIGRATPSLVRQYCSIPDECNISGPVPSPDELVVMDADKFRSLDNCGALRSIMNSWAIRYWINNSTVSTREHLIHTMTCASQLQLVPATFTNFGKLVEACFVQPDIVPIDGGDNTGPPYSLARMRGIFI